MMNRYEETTITVTTGDPAGIGPEVTLKALADPVIRNLARWIVIGEGWHLSELGRELNFRADQTTSDQKEISLDAKLVFLDVPQLDSSQIICGQISRNCGRAGLQYVRTAVDLCLAGEGQAIVTAPLNKEAVARTGIKFCGHTEFIAELCGINESRMLLVNDKLCVVHVSTHCSLSSATRMDMQRIKTTIQLGHEAVSSIRGRVPRIAVCGLNPHAGENGMFGTEEVESIVPAIRAAKNLGIDCAGPYPADTLFMQAVRGKYDLVVAMYHDQGHVPMKLLDFEHTVNITLGLPIIRTSVDHGTAFDIAGKNLADASDMKTALGVAVALAQKKVIASEV